MKVIFLDIDGVLNAEEDFYDENGNRKKIAPQLRTTDGEIYNGISQKRVSSLLKIVEATGAKIVLSSSWKDGYEDYVHGRPDNHIGKYLTNALGRKNLHVIGSTQRFEHNWVERAGGILKWIAAWNGHHPDDWVDGILILDDEDFRWEEFGLSPFWVETRYEGRGGGLNDGLVDKCIAILSLEFK